MRRRLPGRLHPLRVSTAPAALALALSDPVTHALPGSRLREIRHAGLSLSEEFSVLGPEESPLALLWHGANVSPVHADLPVARMMAEHLAGRRRRSSSLVGPRDAVEAMWEVLGPTWGPTRDQRWSQPVLEALTAPSVPPLVGVRPAYAGEEGLVFPASVAMFREEVGTDPTVYDGGRSYHRRVRDLIATGRTYVLIENGAVVFKADVGALLGPVAQIHGVWVDPAQRGRQIARRAMAAVVDLVRRDHAPRVSLYVNDYNQPARRAYAAAGFRQVGELATILF